jgi:Spy/CpxP family protein refolding chaperone
MKKPFGIVMLGLTLAAGGVGLAGEHGRGGDRGARRAERLANELDLTEAQRASWQAMREQHEAEMQPLRDEGRALHEKLRAAMKAENPDPQAVGEATIALERHRQAVEAARKAFRDKLATQLTPEQKAKFDSLAERHRSHRGPDGSRRRGPGRGPAPEGSAPEVEPPASPKS